AFSALDRADAARDLGRRFREDRAHTLAVERRIHVHAFDERHRQCGDGVSRAVADREARVADTAHATALHLATALFAHHGERRLDAGESFLRVVVPTEEVDAFLVFAEREED